MGVFHVFWFVQMVPNRAKRLICHSWLINTSRNSKLLEGWCFWEWACQEKVILSKIFKLLAVRVALCSKKNWSVFVQHLFHWSLHKMPKVAVANQHFLGKITLLKILTYICINTNMKYDCKYYAWIWLSDRCAVTAKLITIWLFFLYFAD